MLALSQYLEPVLALSLLSEGSSRRGYVLKDRADDVEYLVDAITAIADGGSVVGDEVIDSLVLGQLRQVDSPLSVLTPRELEILREVATGQNNGAVASTLAISEHAVQKHINSIFSKLGLVDDGETHRRVAAVLLYLSNTSPMVTGPTGKAVRSWARPSCLASARTAGSPVWSGSTSRPRRPPP